MLGTNSCRCPVASPQSPDAHGRNQSLVEAVGIICRQYDEMVKYATALRLGIPETEAILRHFTWENVQHRTYKALAELDKAVKTIFLCGYLHDEALRPAYTSARIF